MSSVQGPLSYQTNVEDSHSKRSHRRTDSMQNMFSQLCPEKSCQSTHEKSALFEELMKSLNFTIIEYNKMKNNFLQFNFMNAT